MTSTNADPTPAREYFDVFLNGGDLNAADLIFNPDIVFHYPLGELSGIAAVHEYIRTFKAAFPDAHFTVANLMAEPSRAAARWTLDATQKGDFKGRAATGRRVRVPGVTWFDISDGRIREMWVSFDPARLLGD